MADNSEQIQIILNLNSIIQSRKSVYPAVYIDKEISKDILEQIVSNANRAPTHKLTEPWRFKVFTKNAKSQLGIFLAEKYKETSSTEKFRPSKMTQLVEKFDKSAAVIAIVMHRDKNECIPEWEEIAAVAMAMQNMYLTCTAYNIGCYWSSTSVRKFIGEKTPMTSNESCLGFFFMGYYNKDLPISPRQPIEEKVEWFHE